jgi:uncharacterized membrane protein
MVFAGILKASEVLGWVAACYWIAGKAILGIGLILLVPWTLLQGILSIGIFLRRPWAVQGTLGIGILLGLGVLMFAFASSSVILFAVGLFVAGEVALALHLQEQQDRKDEEDKQTVRTQKFL